MELQTIPTWLGAAIVAAGFAAIGYVAKVLFGWLNSLRGSSMEPIPGLGMP
jgi:hypothetical protein